MGHDFILNSESGGCANRRISSLIWPFFNSSSNRGARSLLLPEIYKKIGKTDKIACNTTPPVLFGSFLQSALDGASDVPVHLDRLAGATILTSLRLYSHRPVALMLYPLRCDLSPHSYGAQARSACQKIRALNLSSNKYYYYYYYFLTYCTLLHFDPCTVIDMIRRLKCIVWHIERLSASNEEMLSN